MNELAPDTHDRLPELSTVVELDQPKPEVTTKFTDTFNTLLDEHGKKGIVYDGTGSYEGAALTIDNRQGNLLSVNRNRETGALYIVSESWDKNQEKLDWQIFRQDDRGNISFEDPRRLIPKPPTSPDAGADMMYSTNIQNNLVEAVAAKATWLSATELGKSQSKKRARMFGRRALKSQ